MMASMNAVQEDSIATLKVLFNPDAEIVRQVDLTAFQVDRIISHAEKRRKDANFYYEGPMEYLWQDYSHLLKTYAICFEKEILTRERNEGLFLYAQAEIFNFVKQFKIFKVSFYLNKTKIMDNFFSAFHKVTIWISLT